MNLKGRKIAELTLEEVCVALNAASGPMQLYSVHGAVEGNPVPGTIVRSVQRIGGSYLWHVEDTMTLEAARRQLEAELLGSVKRQVQERMEVDK